MKYNKLVRDKIPEIIHKSGKSVCFRFLNDSELKEHLENKLVEEVEEFRKTKDPEELADIYEVVAALSEVYAGGYEKVKMKQIDKFVERGGFTRGIYLIEVSE